VNIDWMCRVLSHVGEDVRRVAQSGRPRWQQLRPGVDSWDAYGLRSPKDQFRANAKVGGLRPEAFRRTYGVIDEGWFLRNPQDRPHPDQLQYQIDANGRYSRPAAFHPRWQKGAADG